MTSEADRTAGADTVGPGVLFSGPALYRPESAWSPLAALVLTAIACAATLVVAAVAIGIVAAATGSVDAAEIVTSLATWPGVLTMAASQLASLGVIWLAARRGGLRAETLRLAPPKAAWSTALLGGLVVIAITSLFELAMYLAGLFDPFADSKWLVDGLKSPLWWGTVVVVAVLAPLWEELAFRGFLLSGLAKSQIGYWPAALIATILWTLLHWGYSWAGMASVLLAGVLLSWLMWRTGSMRAVVVAHAMANSVALAFAYTFAPTA